MKTVKDKDWNFKNIEGGFDNHVREQLPWYDIVSDMVAFIIRNYVPENGRIYDIGGSTGNLKNLLTETINERGLIYSNLDNEVDMQPDILGDARSFPFLDFDVAILNLTMMFIPVKDRKPLLHKLRSKMNVGGCIIIVDKFIQPESYLSTVLRRATIYWKHKNGVDGNDIVEKELSLSGVQIPMYKYEVGEDAKQFFKFGEFEGFLITKGETNE